MTMVLDVKQWMPQGMDTDEKTAYAEAYPTDPHAAAAAAWEDWASTLEATAATGAEAEVSSTVASVSTGAQSISYTAGTSRTPVTQALERARFHRARAHAQTVEVGPLYAVQTEGEYRADVGYDDAATAAALNDEANDALWVAEP